MTRYSFQVQRHIFSVHADSRNEALAKASAYVKEHNLAQHFSWAYGTSPNNFYAKVCTPA